MGSCGQMLEFQTADGSENAFIAITFKENINRYRNNKSTMSPAKMESSQVSPVNFGSRKFTKSGYLVFTNENKNVPF